MEGFIMNKFGILCILIIFFLSLGACSFNSLVYVSIYWWDDTFPITNFNSNIPGVPTTLATIEKGAYYKAAAGTYSVSYDYGPTNYSGNVTFEESEIVFGREDMFYDVLLLAAPGGPVALKVPQ